MNSRREWFLGHQFQAIRDTQCLTPLVLVWIMRAGALLMAPAEACRNLAGGPVEILKVARTYGQHSPLDHLVIRGLALLIGYVPQIALGPPLGPMPTIDAAALHSAIARPTTGCPTKATIGGRGGIRGGFVWANVSLAWIQRL